jgi:hypothetical protein
MMKKKSKGGVYRIALSYGIIGGVNFIHSRVLVKIFPNEGKKGGFLYA